MSQGTVEVYTSTHAVPAHAHELAAGRRARRRLPDRSSCCSSTRTCRCSRRRRRGSTACWRSSTAFTSPCSSTSRCVMRDFISLHALSPGWVSVRVLAWLSAASCAGAAMLMWLNVDGLAAALNETAVRRMTAGAAATTARRWCCSASRWRISRSAGAAAASAPALLTIAVIGSLALPLAARGPGVVAAAPRRGAAGAVAARPVARAARRDAAARRRVARLHLAARRRRPAAELRAPARERRGDGPRDGPADAPDPVWAAVATGMYPAKNGIARPVALRVRGGDEPLAAAARSLLLARARPPRVAAARAELAGARAPDAVGDPRRRRRLGRRRPLAADVSGAAGARLRPQRSRPRAARIDARVRRPGRVSARGAARSPAPPTRRTGGGQLAAAPSAGFAAEASAAIRDEFYGRAMRELHARVAGAVRRPALRGLDTVGHYYLRYTEPRELGDVQRGGPPPAPAGARPLLRATSTTRSATALAGLAPGDLLLVVSGFGMQPPNPVKRLLARLLGDPMSGTHERAPDGFLLAYGGAVAPGRRQRGSHRRRHADGAVLPRPAGRPRHGRLRARRPLPPRVHRRPPGRVHSDARTASRDPVPPAPCYDAFRTL